MDRGLDHPHPPILGVGVDTPANKYHLPYQDTAACVKRRDLTGDEQHG